MAWLSGWSYRKEITITGQSGAGTNYQVDFSIGDSAGGDFHLEGHCTNFPQDIEVTDNDGTTLLKFWIEDITADPLKMSVKVADDLGSNQTIYVYYGKSGATTNNDGSATFPDLFKDFEIDDLSDWTRDAFTTFETSTDFAVSGSKSLKAHFNGIGAKYASLALTNLDSDHAIDFDFIEMTGGDYPIQLAIDDTIKSGSGLRLGSFIYDDGGFDYLDRTPAWQSVATGLSVSTWYHISINPDVGTDLFDLWWNESPTINDGEFYTTSTANDYFTILLGKGTTSTSGLYIDNLKIRKYNSPEPAFSSAGSEETSPTGVTIPVLMHHYKQMMRA